ncbi:DUF3027 domain-containing protein [Thermocrispum sp.]|uniref:DUF3027 domain-containing protein n=1 Tax=Thermocrispum agreste TaxID=37925 RepID=A0ABD6FA50_9PSEU
MAKRFKDLYAQALGRLLRDERVPSTLRARIARFAGEHGHAADDGGQPREQQLERHRAPSEPAAPVPPSASAPEQAASGAEQVQPEETTSAVHRPSLPDSPTSILEPMTSATEAPPRPAPELLDAVETARAVAREEAADRGYDESAVGDYVDQVVEDAAAVTYRFEAHVPGYRGWRWEITLASAGEGFPVTVSEAVLRPGPDALVAKPWVPWEQRVRPGDLGVGDLLPADPNDERLVPGYLHSDDPAVEEVAREVGLGRVRVLSFEGRMRAAKRWRSGEFGPRSDMARSVRETCGTCGFYYPLSGALRAAFGACCNEYSPADGRVVHVEYGCGAHSEIKVQRSSGVPVAELVYDDTQLDVVPLGSNADDRGQSPR